MKVLSSAWFSQDAKGMAILRVALPVFCGCQNQWDPILVGRCTTHFRTYVSGDWDVHWNYGILTHVAI